MENIVLETMKTKGIVLPTNDLAFKKLFSSNENKEVLKGLIKDFHEINVKEIIIESPYSLESFNVISNDKGGYFETEVDSLCVDENNSKFTMEMQLKRQNFYHKRSFYYLADKYRSTYGVAALQVSKSKYSSLFPTYSLNILGENIYEDDTALHFFTLYDKENHLEFCKEELITLGMFELMKADKNLSENVKRWRNFFLTGTVDNNAPDYMMQARDTIELNHLSEGERTMIDNLERAQEDALARELYVQEVGVKAGHEKGLQEGREKGLLEGMEEGVKEGMKEGMKEGKKDGQKAVLELLEKGYTLEQIKKIVEEDN